MMNPMCSCYVRYWDLGPGRSGRKVASKGHDTDTVEEA